MKSNLSEASYRTWTTIRFQLILNWHEEDEDIKREARKIQQSLDKILEKYEKAGVSEERRIAFPEGFIF